MIQMVSKGDLGCALCWDLDDVRPGWTNCKLGQDEA